MLKVKREPTCWSFPENIRNVCDLTSQLNNLYIGLTPPTEYCNALR